MGFNRLKSNLLEMMAPYAADANYPNEIEAAMHSFDLLKYIKLNYQFFASNEIISKAYFSNFPSDTLEFLGVHTTDFEYNEKADICALAIDCNIYLNVKDGTACSIRAYGKAYVEADCTGTSTLLLKLYNKSKAEVNVTDNAVANIKMLEQSDLLVHTTKQSFAYLHNRSKNSHLSKGTKRILSF